MTYDDIWIKCLKMSVRLKQKKPAKRFRRTPNLSKFETTSAIIWQIGPTITAPHIQPNGPGCGSKRPCCWICYPLLIILKICCSHSCVLERNKCRSLNQCELFLRWFISKHIFSSLSSRACRWIFLRYEMIEFKTSEHCGTHLDAPGHFSHGSWAVSEIPVERLFAPGKTSQLSKPMTAL